MKYVSSAGDYKIEKPGALLVRASRVSSGLKWPFVWTMLVSIVATIARLLGPLVVAGGIDQGIDQGDKRVILIAAAIFVALLAFQYLVTALSQWMIAWVGERYLVQLRGVVFSRILRLDMGFFARSKSGVIVSRMTADIESLQEFASDGAVLALSNLLTVIGVSIALVIVDWQMALAVFGIVAIVGIVSVIFQGQARRAYDLVRERIGAVLANLQEGITGVRVVQAFTQEPDQASTFGRINEDHYEANMAAARAISWYFPVIAFLRVCAMAAALGLGVVRVVDGSMSTGTLVAFLLYLDWFFQPIINLSNVYNLLQSALAALAKLFDLIDEPILVAERDGAYDLPDPVRGSVETDDLSFEYLEGVPTLDSVSIHVEPGERLAIVGETGSGKSTIAKLIMRFYDPKSGVVRVDGQDLRDITKASRVGAMALIPQDGFLFSGTLRDNLIFGAPEATDDDVWRVLETMNIAEWVRSLPEGLATEVRERGSRFSAGERQLVALARAFLADPEIILLDEATSNLDPGTEAKIELALQALLTGRTAIVIAHRLRSAERADRVVMLDDGRVIAEGTHAELEASSAAYKELVDVWKIGLA